MEAKENDDEESKMDVDNSEKDETEPMEAEGGDDEGGCGCEGGWVWVYRCKFANFLIIFTCSWLTRTCLPLINDVT